MLRNRSADAAFRRHPGRKTASILYCSAQKLRTGDPALPEKRTGTHNYYINTYYLMPQTIQRKPAYGKMSRSRKGSTGKSASVRRYTQGLGFGELGATGTRHEGSGLNGGFYVQLGLASDYVGRLDAKDMQRATLSNPLQAVVDAQNPMSMYYNVKMGHDIHGKGSGYMTEANLLSSGSAALKAGGAVAVSVGAKACATGAGCIAGWIPLAAGTASMLAGQSIHADPVTGKRGFGMSEKDWTEFGVTWTAAAAGGYYFGGGATVAGSGFSWGQAALAGGAGAFNTGIQSDAQGHVYGYNLDGARGDSALVAFGVGFAGSAAGQGLAANGIGGAPGSFGSSYASASASALITNSVYYERYLANGDQTYLGMQNGNPGAFWGGIAGGMAGAALGGSIAASETAAEYNDLKSKGYSDAQIYAIFAYEGRAGYNDSMADRLVAMDARQSQQEGQKQSALTIMRGLGYRREDGIADGTVSTDKAATFIIAAMRDKGISFTGEDWKTLMNQSGGLDANGNYGTASLDTVKALLSGKGIDFDTLNMANIAKEMGAQEAYGRMMDGVRAQQAYQSGSSSWDNSYGLSDHYGMLFEKFAGLGIGGSLKWMANSVLNRTSDHDAAARSFATALANDLGISDSAKFADAAQRYAETMTGIKTGDNSGTMMAIGAVLMGRFRLAGSAAGALGAELPGLMRLGGLGLQQLGRQAFAWMAAHPEQAMGMAAVVPGGIFAYLAAREQTPVAAPFTAPLFTAPGGGTMPLQIVAGMNQPFGNPYDFVDDKGIRRQGTHPGWDLFVNAGTPVPAVAHGIVEAIGTDYRRDPSAGDGYGGYVLLRHADGTRSFYAHASKVLVDPGTLVPAGDVIMLSGQSGMVKGPHLHYEVASGVEGSRITDYYRTRVLQDGATHRIR